MIPSWWNNGSTRVMAILIVTCVLFILGFVFFWFVPVGKISYSQQLVHSSETVQLATTTIIEQFKVTHMSTPEKLKAVYFTGWAAGNDKFRKHLFDLVENTEINAVVIDVKDYTGKISFPVDDPELIAICASEKRIPDIKEFISELHKRNVYVIGRISSFQDSYLINIHPEWAVKTKSGKVWADFKGVKWLDTGAEPVWKYLVAIGNEAYSQGFDELNFDYIRYPSDGNMKDIVYSWSNGRTRREVLRTFFSYLHDHFAGVVPISIDLFGLTMTNEDDLGIGQNVSDALPYFDYIYPMVYPSHFASGFLGYTKPAKYPYEVIKYSMGKGIERAISTTTKDASIGLAIISSTTPPLYSKNSYNKNKLRPWLQAFDLGAEYTPEMIRAQIKATYDIGLDGWLLWDAANTYDKNALLPKYQSQSIKTE